MNSNKQRTEPRHAWNQSRLRSRTMLNRVKSQHYFPGSCWQHSNISYEVQKSKFYMRVCAQLTLERCSDETKLLGFMDDWLLNMSVGLDCQFQNFFELKWIIYANNIGTAIRERSWYISHPLAHTHTHNRSMGTYRRVCDNKFAYSYYKMVKLYLLVWLDGC